ncbi:MAG: homoserine O-succinyltransferase [Polyangiaceae bacterium]
MTDWSDSSPIRQRPVTRIFESRDQRILMHLGHPEYEPERLQFEYQRDVAERRPSAKVPDNLDLARPLNIWRSHRNEFFSQWLRFIYESVSRRDHDELAADASTSDVAIAHPSSRALPGMGCTSVGNAAGCPSARRMRYP